MRPELISSGPIHQMVFNDITVVIDRSQVGQVKIDTWRNGLNDLNPWSENIFDLPSVERTRARAAEREAAIMDQADGAGGRR